MDEPKPCTSYADIVENFNKWIINNDFRLKKLQTDEALLEVRLYWRKLTNEYIDTLLKRFALLKTKNDFTVYKEGEE
jgi:hypothetical protein